MHLHPYAHTIGCTDLHPYAHTIGCTDHIHAYTSYLGTRPGYGLFVRNAHGVSIKGLKLGWDTDPSSGARADERPAVVLENATVAVDSLTVARDGSSYDVGIRPGAQQSTVTNSPGIIVKDLQL
jgi:hypothetical protein